MVKKLDTKDRFVESVTKKLPFDDEQKKTVSDILNKELDNYVIHSTEEANHILKEPLEMLDYYKKIRIAEGAAKSTMKQYTYVLNCFFKCIPKKLSDINSTDIRDFLNAFITDGGSISYVNTIRSYLSAFFDWLYNDEYIDKNPMRKVGRIKVNKNLKPSFNEIEVDTLRRVASSNIRDLALIDFLLSTGCRVAEVQNANISDVNFSGKKLHVVGKGNKKRIVYLTDVATASLTRYLQSRKDKNEALFVSDRSPHDRLSIEGIQALLRRVGKTAHINNVHPHRFRHTCCTRLLCRGMSLQDVARILGHEDVNTTMLYNNTSDEYIDNRFRRFSF